MLRTLLVPVEGSSHSTKALEFAVDYAVTHGSELLVLSVWRTLRLPDNTHSLVRATMRDQPPEAELKSVAQAVVDHAVALATERGVAKADGYVRQGPVARTIVDFAAEKEADAIVIGSRGLGDVTGLLLGSVSHKVCNMAACTCIVVK